MTAFDFWVRHVELAGGLSERAGDVTYVVLPEPLRDAYGLPEELRVTAHPDVAREDGATLLTQGHPVLAKAAERVLASGDAGVRVLARPTSVPPGRDVLLAEAREAFPVDHGRIDLDEGEPAAVLHPVVRTGALVTYELSADDRFQEQMERWLDVPARRELPAPLVGRLTRCAVADAPGPVPDGLLTAISEAHKLIDRAAVARREALRTQVGPAYEAERNRATAYYADAIAGLERRLASASPDRREMIEQRIRSTREESRRRLEEIAEKYEGRHLIRPFRLHVINVPALRVRLVVRRGERRYPLSIDWLLPTGCYAPMRCPSCGGEAMLVASKQKLGCEDCVIATPSSLEPAPEPAAREKRGPSPAKRTAPPARPSPPAARPGIPPARPGTSAKPPVPPKAKREAAIPPHIRKDRLKASAKLAERLWPAVAMADHRTLSKILADGSPAAALYGALGPAAFTWVIGLPVDEEADRFDFAVVPDSGGQLLAGAVLGTAGTECRYFASCQDGQVAEILPFPPLESGGFIAFYWWSPFADGRRATAVKPARGLAGVEDALIRAGTKWNGLPVVARALASWQRLEQQRLLAAHEPAVLAATVHRLVTYRAGGRGTFAEAASAYRVPEQAVRAADRLVRPRLALGPDRPW